MKAMVYTIDRCPYCDAAKELLTNKLISFEEINISNDDEQKIALITKTGHRTMPQIFIDDNFIGGYNELALFLKNNEKITKE
jgi:glutaredoxin